MLLPGKVSDRTYNADGKRTADAIRSQLGFDVTVTQGVPIPSQSEVYREFARKGYDLVIGWGGQFTDGAVMVTPQFPKTQFLVVNADAKNGSNLSSMNENNEQWDFVAGYVAARLSTSKVVGWVGGQCFPGTAVEVNGWRQGVAHGDKNAKFVSIFTGDFEDPTKAQQAAQAMIDKGADWLGDNLNNGTFGVINAAQSAGDVKLILEWLDNHALAPDVIASDVLKSQTKFVVSLVKQAANDGLGGKHYQFSLPKDWGPALVKTPLIPDDVYKDALEVQRQVAAGEIDVKHDTRCPS